MFFFFLFLSLAQVLSSCFLSLGTHISGTAIPQCCCQPHSLDLSLPLYLTSYLILNLKIPLKLFLQHIQKTLSCTIFQKKNFRWFWLSPANTVSTFLLSHSFARFFIALVVWSMSEGPAIGPLPYPYSANYSAAVPAETLQPPDSTFKLLLTVIHPSKCICTLNWKTKNTKPVSEDKGPFDISVKVGWFTFLGIITEKLAVQPSDLIVTSLVWHWLKPASGPWLPV